MDFNKIKELLKGLVTDSTTDEQLEQIGAINQELNNAETEYTDLVTKQEDLRKKYIEVIKDTSFSQKPKEDENSQPMSLEECFQAEIDKRKEK